MKDSGRFYILDDAGDPVACADLLVWGRWIEDNDRQVAEDFVTFKDVTVRVSTVFLGLDHNFGDGPPILYETMVFEGENDQDQYRYGSREEALAGHEAVLAELREAVDGG